MSARYRTVALQTVGVAVLAAVIFIAFLRPSDPGELSGIDAPGGGDGPTAVNSPDDGKKKKGEKAKGDEQNRPDGGDRPSGRRATNGDGSSGGGPYDNTPASPESSGGPVDDQYTDLVSGLMEKVGEPEVFKEIDEP